LVGLLVLCARDDTVFRSRLHTPDASSAAASLDREDGLMSPFALHPQLAADTLPLGRLPLSLLRVMNDAGYPWLILVPRKPDVRELYELPEKDRTVLSEEIALVSKALAEATEADKINVAALGNVVPQLHVHVIARFLGDQAWPAPVWGRFAPRPWEETDLASFSARLVARLGPNWFPDGGAG
jgi:diadenosine tetraphosphate (Ap4A) HIT family hydrolase